MEIKTYEQIKESMTNYIIAHQDKITDFNEGSIASSLTEASAREIAMLYIRCRVGFSTYLRGLPFSVFGFKSKEGSKSSCRVVFSRSKVLSNDSRIPSGSIVSDGSLQFFTTEEGVIESGEQESKPITVIAENIGEKYNAAAGTIKVLKTALSPDIVSVNNNEAATGGTNVEDWGAYLDRFSDYLLGLSRTNMYGFVTALKESNLIRSLEIEEHFPPQGGIWNMSVYLEDGSGGMTDEAITKAKKIIDGDISNNIGGYRAPGINIRYLPPEKIAINLQVQITTIRDVANEIDVSAVIFDVTEAAQKFINNLKIGQSILCSDLIIVLKQIYYVDDVKILIPKDNITISKKQIARFEQCDVLVVIP